ncbi:MAG: hypothetical protein R2698_06835 [Microthrixaceae bacterium]
MAKRKATATPPAPAKRLVRMGDVAPDLSSEGVEGFVTANATDAAGESLVSAVRDVLKQARPDEQAMIADWLARYSPAPRPTT